ncbi:MAG: Efflux pump periplasmic linker BepF [Candidatus Accumulibacter appositus]|uniref:Efflux pump periplasmic linker BepF n=1 Tax=Candidatus Accumulibacter appositus TaxID=1454003 RepID=A0A011QQA9_9PROT|nr:efflux RND transporter periplasmic adaptor subunit [Accumulibacter sp.]EXI81059.1 MAG: Efflux pump periplasmic linker BepF [Candidatus Accumulibacter appositus]HRF05709.1 efflux RND transporter periplasmic adaptor subunit [Accumulibacter sp.]
MRRNIDLHLLLAGLSLLCGTALAADPPPSVIVAPARQVQFADSIEALGTVAARESVALTATVTDTVSALHFDDGDRVSKGQLLAELSSREEHAQLEEARATVKEALRQYQRFQSLAARGTTAKSLLDERQRDWQTARARLAAIESRLADRLIKAPFAGVVGLRDLSVGALVEPGDLITTLDDDSAVKLEFPVPATYLQGLRPGLKVTASSRAYPGRTFSGTVKAVNSRIDPVTRSIRVRATLPNPAHLLRPGMLMNVVVQQEPRTTLLIPEESLLPLGEQQFVLVVSSDGKADRRELQIGGRRPGLVEVVTGIAAGEQVITHGHMQLRPGQAVRIIAVDDGSRSLPELLRSLPGGAGTP